MEQTQNKSAKRSGRMSPPARPAGDLRQPSNGLRLAPMPKYHPAVYRSTASKAVPSNLDAKTRDLFLSRNPARRFSEAQQQQQEYQRQMLATLRQTSALVGTVPSDTPSAPHLLPLVSPGPTTPLDLEESGDYLTARSIGEGSPRDMTDKLIREEQERRRGMRVDRSSRAVSPRC